MTHRSPMSVDAKTLRDLEIFQTRDGKPGVLQTLDRTKTPAGSLALRARFDHPISEGSGIREVQAGLRFLTSRGIGFPADPNRIAEVKQYMDSPWDVGSRARGIWFLLESILVSIRYRDLFVFVVKGIGVTKHVLTRIIPFLDDVLSWAPPEEIRNLVEGLAESVAELEPDRLPENRRPWAVFGADRKLRIIKKDVLRRFFDLLSDLDALVAMAEVTEERGFVYPEVAEGPEFILDGEGVFHPFLTEPVGNPVSVLGGGAVLFLTGPNMSGKTTYLKAVAVSSFLAHLGMGVPARRFRFSPLDALYGSLSPEENLWEGLSYFMAEVRRVREVLEGVAAGSRSLVIFDEVFRGTNVNDALDASLLVIKGITGSRTSGFIFSSHLVELAEELESVRPVTFGYFEGFIEEGRARYEFRLREGVSRQRFGLQLLEEEGVPKLLDSLDEKSVPKPLDSPEE
jgi:DNA mismatch repair protein MutS